MHFTALTTLRQSYGYFSSPKFEKKVIFPDIFSEFCLNNSDVPSGGVTLKNNSETSRIDAICENRLYSAADLLISCQFGLLTSHPTHSFQSLSLKKLYSDDKLR